MHTRILPWCVMQVCNNEHCGWNRCYSAVLWWTWGQNKRIIKHIDKRFRLQMRLLQFVFNFAHHKYRVHCDSLNWYNQWFLCDRVASIAKKLLFVTVYNSGLKFFKRWFAQLIDQIKQTEHIRHCWIALECIHRRVQSNISAALYLCLWCVNSAFSTCKL